MLITLSRETPLDDVSSAIFVLAVRSVGGASRMLGSREARDPPSTSITTNSRVVMIGMRSISIMTAILSVDRIPGRFVNDVDFGGAEEREVASENF